MTTKTKPPVFLNLFRIRFPVTAILSILHRLTGVLLFLCLPAMIYVLQYSLSGPQEYDAVRAALNQSWARLGWVLLLWALLHHYLAGIRYLLLDVDWGVTRGVARQSAWTVNLAALLAAIVIGVAL